MADETQKPTRTPAQTVSDYFLRRGNAGKPSPADPEASPAAEAKPAEEQAKPATEDVRNMSINEYKEYLKRTAKPGTLVDN